MQPRKAERIAWTVIGLLTAFWLWFGIASAVSERLGWTNSIMHVLLPGGSFAIVGGIAWRWRTVGAVLFIVAGAFVAIAYPAIYLEFFPASTVILVVGTMAVPTVVAGILLLAASRHHTHFG